MNLTEFAEMMHLSEQEAKDLLEQKLGISVIRSSAPFLPGDETQIMKLLKPPENSPAEQPVSDTLKTGYITDAEKFILRCALQDYLILVDTCAILEIINRQSAFEKLTDKIRPVLKKTGKKLIIPYVVDQEVEFLSKHGDSRPKNNAQRMLPVIRKLTEEEKDIFVCVGSRADWPRDDNKPFADPVFRREIIHFREKGRNVLLITQDKNLTAAILRENNDGSIRSKSVIEVRMLNEDGNLVLNPAVVDVPRFKAEGVLYFRPAYIPNNRVGG